VFLKLPALFSGTHFVRQAALGRTLITAVMFRAGEERGCDLPWQPAGSNGFRFLRQIIEYGLKDKMP